MKYLVQRVGAVLTTDRADLFGTLDEALAVAQKRVTEMQHAHIIIKLEVVARANPVSKPKRGRPRKVAV